MRLFSRARQVIAGPPDGAHGRRNIDGSYFAIWKCQEGHGAVGDADEPPSSYCRKCAWKVRTGEAERTRWTHCDQREAEDFMFELEGFRMYDRIGFTLVSRRGGISP